MPPRCGKGVSTSADVWCKLQEVPVEDREYLIMNAVPSQFFRAVYPGRKCAPFFLTRLTSCAMFSPWLCYSVCMLDGQDAKRSKPPTH